MNKQFSSLTEAFLTHFEVDLVTTPEQAAQVARLRYRVYCHEFGFEPAAKFPNLQETDEFDAHSLQCLITHRRSNHPAGCVRLVCATNEQALPLEAHCLENVYQDYLESLLTDQRLQVAEVSRLAVDSAFRRRPGEEHTRLGEFDAVDCTHQEQRTFSMISMAAVLAAFAMSSLSNRPELYSMMESNLPRLLRRAGILMQKAGDTTNYHGRRAPYYISTGPALENMRDDLHVMYDSIYHRLSRHYQRAERVGSGLAGFVPILVNPLPVLARNTPDIR